jgi:peptide/nickel transport system permease protein
MIRYILRRILQIFPTLFIVVTITFVLTRMVPGDPVTAMVGDQADPRMMERIRQEMGLRDPLFVQYLRYLGNLFRGDFGRSYFYNRPVGEIIAERIPNTLLLTLTSLILATVGGILMGVAAAYRQSSFLDYILTLLSLVGVSLPVFWVGLMLVLVFSVTLGWLPTFGMTGSVPGLGELLRHMILPCITLTLVPLASFVRITRSSVIEALGTESIRSIRARGLTEGALLWRHGLKNALPPVVTVVGMQLAGAFSGAVLTENIFSWPGMGTMISNAINNRDYSLIQGTVMVIAIAFVAVNLLTDLVYMLVNPKFAAESMSRGTFNG